MRKWFGEIKKLSEAWRERERKREDDEEGEREIDGG
jgi:hypothetical protein